MIVTCFARTQKNDITRRQDQDLSKRRPGCRRMSGPPADACSLVPRRACEWLQRGLAFGFDVKCSLSGWRETVPARLSVCDKGDFHGSNVRLYSNDDRLFDAICAITSSTLLSRDSVVIICCAPHGALQVTLSRLRVRVAISPGG